MCRTNSMLLVVLMSLSLYLCVSCFFMSYGQKDNVFIRQCLCADHRPIYAFLFVYVEAGGPPHCQCQIAPSCQTHMHRKRTSTTQQRAQTLNLNKAAVWWGTWTLHYYILQNVGYRYLSICPYIKFNFYRFTMQIWLWHIAPCWFDRHFWPHNNNNGRQAGGRSV